MTPLKAMVVLVTSYLMKGSSYNCLRLILFLKLKSFPSMIIFYVYKYYIGKLEVLKSLITKTYI